MADLATVTDVETRWRTLTADETAVVEVLLGDASGIIRVEVPTVDARITDGTLDADTVAGVVVQMVLRVMRNPDGKVQESIDDYAYRRADAVADGALYLRDYERRLLQPARARAGSTKLQAWRE